MKKFFLFSCIAAVSVCKSYAFTTVIVKDSISTNTRWTCDQQYQLQGNVYVTAGATLTIDAGVVIKGDKDSKGTLIIERNAKIMAMGTAEKPVVFTSNQEAGSRTYGDWGGVFLCGNAPANWTGGQAQVEGGPRSFYGGNDIHDNSGEMHYVRIEFGGIALSPNNEVNSLTLCGIGDATQIDHIQISYAGDDAIEWFGGTVKAKYLVTLRTWDDDFDSDAGFQGKVQFAAVIRDNVADLSGSKAFESDSYIPGTTYSGLPYDATKVTNGVFSNVTAIGPIVNPSATTTDPNFVAGAHIRRGSALSIVNSVFAGWPCGLLIDESVSTVGPTSANLVSGEMQFRNNIICGTSSTGGFNKDVVFVKDGARNLTPTSAFAADTTTPFSPAFSGPLGWFRTASFLNKTYATQQSSVFLGNPYNLLNPNLVPNSTSPIVYGTWKVGTATVAYDAKKPINLDTTGGMVNYNAPAVYPDFTSTKASDAFFTKVTYVGAFAGTGATSDNWMKGWCEFNPNEADYSSACYVAPPIDYTGVATVGNGAFATAKVYPNPAKEEARVSLDMKQAGIVKIVVLDMTGKMVKEIFNGAVAAGEQSFECKTADLSNGLYVVSISSGNNVKSLKLSIAK